MADLAELTQLIEPEAQALGLALVRVKMFGAGSDATLQVMAERPDTRQLTIDDCAELSRRISDRFDALEEAGRDPIEHAYRLEVSSPGIERPLVKPIDFDRYRGREVRVSARRPIDGRKNFSGILDGLRAGHVVLREPKGDEVALPLDDIAKAHLVFRF